MQFPSDQDATGRSFGSAELTALAQVLDSGTLTSTKGAFVKRFEETFAQHLGIAHAHACASGSAALHTALAALELEPGDEVVTTSVTDMGALAPILYQLAVPVFADVDPSTCNLTAQTISAVLSERTRAIVVTHLFGNPCDMAPIVELARERGIALIEDCAQAYGAAYAGRPAGTFGDIACFSLQQGKHITCGEGGIVVSNDDALARKMYLYINKGWGYGDAKPDHYFLALNYRLSELQGAVAYAQLQRLEEFVAVRRARAAELNAAFASIEGIAVPLVHEAARHSYWKYAIAIDESVYPEGPGGFARLLRDENILTVPRYIQKPAFECEIFAARRTFGTSQLPFSGARAEAVDYAPHRFPGTYQGLKHVLVFPLNERYEARHTAAIAEAMQNAALRLRMEAVRAA